MNWMELLRSMQAPAVDTETGYYDTYQPNNMNYIYGSSTGEEQRGPYIIGSSTGEVQNLPYRSPLIFGTSRDRRPLPDIKQVITETDDDQPNKRVTTINYPQVDTRELGSLSMGPQSMMAAERRGYDPTLMQSEEKIDMDRLYTDTIGNTGMTSDQIIQGAMGDPMYPPTEYATPMAAGAILPRIFGRGKAAKAGTETSPILDASGKAVEKAAQAADELAQSSGLVKPALTAGGIGAGAVGVGSAIRDVPPVDETMVSPDDLMTTPSTPSAADESIQRLKEIGGTVVDAVGLLGTPNPESAPTSVWNPVTGERIPLGPTAETTDVPPADSGYTPTGLLSEFNYREPGSAPLESENRMFGVNSEGQIIQRMPKPDMSGWKSEGQKAALAEQERKSRIYANYNYDPKEKLAEYEKAMRSIYAKSLLLDAIAQFTGGKSQAKRFVDMSIARMEMEEKFDDQERLLNIQRGVYYDENGVYDPPKNEQEAFERVIAFGGSPALAEKIAGYAPKKDTRAFVNWYNPVTKQTATLRTGERPEGSGWVLGNAKSDNQGGDSSSILARNAQTLMNNGNMFEAYQEVLKYLMGKRPTDFAGQPSSNLAEKTRAIQYVHGMLPRDIQAELTLPSGLDKKKMEEWEASMRAKGYGGYPFLDETGKKAGFIRG